MALPTPYLSYLIDYTLTDLIVYPVADQRGSADAQRLEKSHPD